MERTTAKRPGAATTERAPSSRTGTLRRCGGTSCPPGTCDHDEGAPIRRYATGPSTDVPPIVHEVLSSGGRPLDPPARLDMEARFGHDFGAVRIHSDDRAARSARTVRSRAYTVGHDVVLGSDANRTVLMHELAHVVQHDHETSATGAAGLVVGSATDPAERDADVMALAAESTPARPPGPARVDTGRPTPSGSAAHPSGTLRRQLAPPSTSSCRIQFQHDSVVAVDPIERDACVESARQYVAGGGARTVTVHGYASEEGDATYNADLARRRAQEVKRLVTAAGVPESAVVPLAHGEDRTYPGLEPNRRVEVVLSESVVFPAEQITVAKFRCGPDVTAQVGRAVARAHTLFGGWTPDQRTESCEALRGVTTGSYAWDIVQLHNNAWILGYRPHCATQGATPPCGSTVQVGAECYYSGSPNYVIFGTMCRLCYDHFHSIGRAGSMPGYTGYMDFTERSMLDLIDLYKSSSGNVGPSKTWAAAGRDGWPAGGSPPPGDRAGCAPQCSVPYSGPDFDVNWYPHEFHTGGDAR